MTQSAAAQAQELKISQIGDFKKRLGGIIELPSGLVVRYKNPGGIQAFLGGESGVPNALLTTVQKTLKKGKGGAPVDSPENQSALAKDPDTMKQMLELMDRATAKAIVEPQVHLTPTLAELEAYNESVDAEEDLLHSLDDLKDPELLYIDEIPDNDKQFIFGLITGGVKDLQDFRSRTEGDVGSLADGEKPKAVARKSPRANRR